MSHKQLVRLVAVSSIGLVGFTATIFCGLAAIEGKDIPMALLAVAVGGSNLLGGWLNQPNGRDTDNAG